MTQEELDKLNKEAADTEQFWAKLNEEDESCTSAYFDWKEFCEDGIDRLRDALEPLGVQVLEDPATKGSDTYGLIFARKRIMND